MTPSPTPPPHILYNPTQHMVTYAGFCPSGQTLPAYPNYPVPMQVRGPDTRQKTVYLHYCCFTLHYGRNFLALPCSWHRMDYHKIWFKHSFSPLDELLVIIEEYVENFYYNL